MSSFDVLIVGAGPAGLAAALALCRQLYRTVVFDSGKYRNSVSKHMHTVPSWDHRDSKDFRAAARKEILSRYHTTTFVDQGVESLQHKAAGGGTFEATTSDGKTYTGKKVIVATGVKDIYPDIPGYAECWGRTIFHCLFCHGYEERDGEHAGLLAIDNMANPQFALPVSCMAKNLARSVTIFTHGNNELADSLREEASKHSLTIDARKILRFEQPPQQGGMVVHFRDGSSEKLSFLAHTPRTQQNTTFAEQLELEVLPSGDIKTTAPFNETSVHGVFAVGDCGSLMKAVPLALSNGTLTAGGVVHQLCMGK